MTQVVKTITAVTKATGAFTKVTVELQKQIAGLTEMSASVESLAGDIEFKQQQLDAIEQAISDAQRKANAELKLRILEDEDEVVAGILADRGHGTINLEELRDLRRALASAEQGNEDAIENAVAAAKRTGEANLASAVSSVKSANEVASANDKARITMLETQLTDVRETNAELKSMLNDERQARVDIAKAGTNINVSAPSK